MFPTINVKKLAFTLDENNTKINCLSRSVTTGYKYRMKHNQSSFVDTSTSIVSIHNSFPIHHRGRRLTTAYWKPNFKDLYGNLS